MLLGCIYKIQVFIYIAYIYGVMVLVVSSILLLRKLLQVSGSQADYHPDKSNQQPHGMASDYLGRQLNRRGNVTALDHGYPLCCTSQIRAKRLTWDGKTLSPAPAQRSLEAHLLLGEGRRNY